MRRAFQEAFSPRRKEEGGALARRDGAQVLTWERIYTLLTPLFGGGVEPREADPVSVVRATAVRGHLRFWWRALRGWRAGGSPERLWELESALFGHAGEGGASPLSVEVEVLERGQEAYPFTDVPGKKFPQANREVAHPYLAFPLRRTEQDPRNYPVRVGVAFRLRLRFPERAGGLDLREELEAALWAWETFGGIGARTRRGFGALLPQGVRPPTEGEVRERLRRYSREAGWPEGVPHLTPKSLVRVVPLSWRELAERYQAFRQARPGGNSKSPGRSYWPEPDEVRRLTGRHAPNHPPRHPVRKFPRAHFGLPIIFHFKDKGDPSDTTLQLEEAERRASPLLFRPLGEGQRPCLVAVLEGARFPGGKLILEDKRNGRTWDVDPWLTPVEARGIRVLGGEVDPVLAFVKSL
ncbi:CRISPR-associated protein TM1795 family protein [Thermus thermophilus]|uniref:type III-B CRISPR module RAMP protein Cmr1 n=1 Tax=Thermus thermophilus TaxID=274 RepID=UPI00090C8840|nr:type III-B CRISPR module RAMP protein Cmr1 [Thermus thermophilus]BAW02884.1 CRISPR-associated protein TM1795 family protein [Thermus thermophilus]BDB11113.1 type III-B CRISPR module RAMP protein Cmr1 [Thermus thermophilus]